MDTKFDFAAHGGQDVQQIVYVRPVEVRDLPSDIRAQVGPATRLYAVHNEDGERLALVRDRDLAFVLARQNDLAPVNVH